MAVVDLKKVSNYDPTAVKVAIDSQFDAVLSDLDLSGRHVVIKPNLLKANRPEEGVTTHPVVVSAVAEALMARGAEVTLAESPGGPFTENYLKSVYAACGMTEAASQSGFKLNVRTDKSLVSNPRGLRLKQMEVMQAVLEADYLVNIAKLKTHGMMMLTAGVKNLFGVIPGLSKVDMHFRIREVDHFAEQLVDICDFVNPLLTVIDGIEGMDGNGPSAGRLTRPGVLIASDSPFAADLVAAKLVGLGDAYLPTLHAAEKRGLPGSVMDEVRLTGEAFESFDIPPYRLPDSKSITVTGGVLPSFLEVPLRNALTPKPALIKARCVRCGVCRKHCPATCITMTPYPTFDYTECIRCFCCHELCPEKAIRIKTNRVYERLIHK